MYLLFIVTLPVGANAIVVATTLSVDVLTILLVLILPPDTLPAADTKPPVSMLAPVMLPPALAVPPVAKLPPVTVPLTLMTPVTY